MHDIIRTDADHVYLRDLPLVVAPILSTARAVTSPSPRLFHHGRVIRVSLCVVYEVDVVIG